MIKKFYRFGFRNFVLSFVILMLFSLRFVNLTKIPVFADEAIYIRWAQVMKAEETLRFLPLSDGKQPLYMWVTTPFLKVINDPLFAGRLVSVLSGLGTMVGVGVLSWLLFRSKKAALAASAIYAVSPYTFFFNRMALADSMLAMFGVWTFIFSYLAVTKARFDYAMLAGFALGGAWLTKSPALFFILMLPTLLVFSPKRKLMISTFYLLITAFIGYGFYNILRLGPNFSQISARNADYVYPLSHILSDPFNPFRTFLLMSYEWIVSFGPWTLILLAAIGILVNWKKNRKQLIVLGFWFVAPILVQSEFAKVFTARYILFTIPYLIILAASAFNNEKEKITKILTFALAFFVAQSLVLNYSLLTNPERAKLHRSERSGYLEEWTAGQGIKETADYLKNEIMKSGDTKIVVGTEGYFGTLPDGLQMYLNDTPEITVIGVGLNFTEPILPLIESEAFGNKTYLLANDERLHTDLEKSGYTLVATYPKAIRPDGTYQSLLLFELTK
jgi:4-amino-4-deoxy-L-arabinose transferase-like glycosyltransferase